MTVIERMYRSGAVKTVIVTEPVLRADLADDDGLHRAGPVHALDDPAVALDAEDHGTSLDGAGSEIVLVGAGLVAEGGAPHHRGDQGVRAFLRGVHQRRAGVERGGGGAEERLHVDVVGQHGGEMGPVVPHHVHDPGVTLLDSLADSGSGHGVLSFGLTATSRSTVHAFRVMVLAGRSYTSRRAMTSPVRRSVTRWPVPSSSRSRFSASFLRCSAALNALQAAWYWMTGMRLTGTSTSSTDGCSRFSASVVAGRQSTGGGSLSATYRRNRSAPLGMRARSRSGSASTVCS